MSGKVAPSTRRAVKEAEQRIVKWAVAFCNDPEIRESFEALEGTQSASAPAEFMNLCEAVDDRKRLLA